MTRRFYYVFPDGTVVRAVRGGVDNTTLDPGAGGDVIATDDIAGVKYQRVKATWGADGTATDVADSDGSRLPIKAVGAAAENAAVAGNPVLVGGRFDTIPRTLGDGDVGAPALAADGAVHVDDGGNALTVDWNGTAPPIGAGVEATALRVTLATDSTGVVSVDDNGAALTVDNAGTFATQVDGAALTALQKIDDPVIVDDALFTPATSSVMMAGAEFDDTAPDSVDEGDAGALRMSANRNLYSQIRDAAGSERGANVDASNRLTVLADLGSIDNAVLDSILAAVDRTLSFFKSIDLDETEEAVKTSAGDVHYIMAFNLTAAPLFLKLYDASVATVVVGTTTPDHTYVVPGNADSDGAGFVIPLPPGGIPFATAITAASTTGVADADAGAPAANACVVEIGYA